MMTSADITTNTAAEEQAQRLNQFGAQFLPGHLGINILTVEKGKVTAELPVLPHLLAPNGYLHAGSVVTLADTACGYGCVASLPEGAQSFTTIELKSNHLGTARAGTISVVATAVHLGRTTHVWDAVVSYEGKTIALFRCTQMILFPRKDA
ncbi:PaaI family thioesterase [Undibacterium sp. Ji42W]|uniref:PaaI family thioesterase n=1 Tax=Undibacterium sp. Ji42W TaxID=3413039 RepID=UPI003BF5C2F9